jgi:hypothetical protein
VQRLGAALANPAPAKPLTASTYQPESRLEGGVNRANLKFTNLSTNYKPGSVRNRNESEREGAKQTVSK